MIDNHNKNACIVINVNASLYKVINKLYSKNNDRAVSDILKWDNWYPVGIIYPVNLRSSSELYLVAVF